MRARQWALLAPSFLMVFATFPALVASADPASAPEGATMAASISDPNTATASTDPNQALSAFHVFTETWMDRLRGASALQTVAASPAGRVIERFSTTHTVEVKATGSPSNPYVGLLRYTEELYQCTDAAETACTIVDSTPVTEIFRYQNGAWIY